MSLPKPDFFNGFVEPSVANTDYPPIYPYNNVTQTPSGHSFELDDTPTRERVRLQHRSNTYIEMQPGGDEVHKIFGNGYTITLGDHNISIGVDDGKNAKKLNITVFGDVNMTVKGDLLETVEGNVEKHIKGNFSQTVEGIASFVSTSDTNIIAGGTIAGGVKIYSGGYVYVDSDLQVNPIRSTRTGYIAASGRVDSLVGMGAGPAGFVTLLGGVSAGIPVAVPGQINALVSVSAPLGTFGVCSALWSYDTINLLLHNTHIHLSPKGPTGTPLPLELGA